MRATLSYFIADRVAQATFSLPGSCRRLLFPPYLQARRLPRVLPTPVKRCCRRRGTSRRSRRCKRRSKAAKRPQVRDRAPPGAFGAAVAAGSADAIFVAAQGEALSRPNSSFFLRAILPLLLSFVLSLFPVPQRRFLLRAASRARRPASESRGRAPRHGGPEQVRPLLSMGFFCIWSR